MISGSETILWRVSISVKYGKEKHFLREEEITLRLRKKTTDFLSGKRSRIVRNTSFLPGVNPAALDEILPEFIIKALKRAIREFDKKMRGFITEESHLIGVETRTSSPVRICRNINGQSSGVRGLYPCGEGAGYAGGIMSSAIDGIKAAENLINNLS